MHVTINRLIFGKDLKEFYGLVDLSFMPVDQLMEKAMRISKQRAVQQLLGKVETDTAYRQEISFRRVFLDEAQDLTALEIKYFATISRQGTVIVGDDEFDFQTSTGVRLSTTHSAKGLEFPVVFLLLPVVTGDKAVADDEAVTRMRNLVYVSLTRAMDNLQVFTTKAAVQGSDPAGEAEQMDPRQVITEVVGCFDRFRSED